MFRKTYSLVTLVAFVFMGFFAGCDSHSESEQLPSELLTSLVPAYSVSKTLLTSEVSSALHRQSLDASWTFDDSDAAAPGEVSSLKLTDLGPEFLLIPISDGADKKHGATSRTILYSVGSNTATFMMESWEDSDHENVRVTHLLEGAVYVFSRHKNSGKIKIKKEAQGNAAGKVDGCWEDCMDMAISACMDDWGCVIECGIIFNYCAAAISISCYISCNN